MVRSQQTEQFLWQLFTQNCFGFTKETEETILQKGGGRVLKQAHPGPRARWQHFQIARALDI